MKGIADTGFLVAFANRNDRHHEWALALGEGVTDPLLTCEAVLAETAFHLRSVALTLALVRDGLVAVAFDCRENWPQLTTLARRYEDRSPDLADLCLIRMSELPAAQRDHRGSGGLPGLPTQQERDDPHRVSARRLLAP